MPATPAASAPCTHAGDASPLAGISAGSSAKPRPRGSPTIVFSVRSGADRLLRGYLAGLAPPPAGRTQSASGEDTSNEFGAGGMRADRISAVQGHALELLE